MTPASTWDVRPLTERDVPELLQLASVAFHIDPPADFITDVVLPMLEPPRLTDVRDPAAGDPLVGTAAILSRRMTFPGRVHPVAAVRRGAGRLAAPRHSHRHDARAVARAARARR